MEVIGFRATHRNTAAHRQDDRLRILGGPGLPFRLYNVCVRKGQATILKWEGRHLSNSSAGSRTTKMCITFMESALVSKINLALNTEKRIDFAK